MGGEPALIFAVRAPGHDGGMTRAALALAVAAACFAFPEAIGHGVVACSTAVADYLTAHSGIGSS